MTIPVNTTDPGSDDLIFSWLWGDGITATESSLVNPPQSDPAKSPSVQSRDVTLEATHDYVDACLHEFETTVTPGARLGAVQPNGAPALRIGLDGEVDTAISLTVDNGRITRIYAIRNPNKLGRLGEAMQLRRTC